MQLSSAMSAAAKTAGTKAGAAKAASEAFEGALDIVVALGWAYTECFCLENFSKVRRRAHTELQIRTSKSNCRTGLW